MNEQEKKTEDVKSLMFRIRLLEAQNYELQKTLDKIRDAIRFVAPELEEEP